jgi:hypothetical protein
MFWPRVNKTISDIRSQLGLFGSALNFLVPAGGLLWS